MVIFAKYALHKLAGSKVVGEYLATFLDGPALVGLSDYCSRHFCFVCLFGARTRAMGCRMQAHTFPELLSKGYDSRFLHIFAAIVILIFMPLYTPVVSMGAAKVIEITFQVRYDVALFMFCSIVPLYVTMGGFKGVMYTDAL